MLKKIIEKYKSGAFREMWNETKWLYSYAAKYRWLIALYIAIGLFATGLALAASLVTKNLINEVLGEKFLRLRWHSMCFSAFPVLPFPP